MYQPRAGQPFGDIFNADTPETDRASAQASQQLFQQQQQRMNYLQKQGAVTDGLMNRELTKVRSADVPDLMNSYQTYKSLKQQLLFDNNLKKDPIKYDQVNRQANAALADTYKLADESTEQNQKFKNLATAQRQKPDLYADNFNEMLNQGMSMKTPDLANHPLGDADNYRYQGSTIDLQKVDKAARGASKKTYSENVPADPNGIQSDVTEYKYGAPPAQYKSSMLDFLNQHKGERSAAYLLANIPPEEIAKTNEAYNAVTPQEWLQKTGKAEPQDVTPANPNNKSEVLSSYLAQKSFLNNNVEAGKPQRVTNADAKMALTDKMSRDRFNYEEKIRQADKLVAQDHSSANIEKRTQVAADAGSKLWQGLMDNAIPGVDPGLQGYKELPLDAKSKLDLSNTLDANGKKVPIDEARINPKGGIDIYLGGEKTETIPETEAKVRVVGGLLGKSVAAKSIVPPAKTVTEKIKVSSGGKSKIEDLRNKYKY